MIKTTEIGNLKAIIESDVDNGICYDTEIKIAGGNTLPCCRELPG